MIREPAVIALHGTSPWRKFLETLPPIHKRVQAGAVWLNFCEPLWVECIVHPIVFGAEGRDVLSQVFGGPFTARRPSPLTIRQEFAMGFALPGEKVSNAAYFSACRELEQGWHIVVSARLQSRSLPAFTRGRQL